MSPLYWTTKSSVRGHFYIENLDCTCVTQYNILEINKREILFWLKSILLKEKMYILNLMIRIITRLQKGFVILARLYGPTFRDNYWWKLDTKIEYGRAKNFFPCAKYKDLLKFIWYIIVINWRTV